MLNNLKRYIIDDEYLIGVYEKRIYVFNYKKIIDVSNTIIKIELNNKLLLVNGNNLVIEKMDKKEILISGTIKGSKIS